MHRRVVASMFKSTNNPSAERGKQIRPSPENITACSQRRWKQMYRSPENSKACFKMRWKHISYAPEISWVCSKTRSPPQETPHRTQTHGKEHLQTSHPVAAEPIATVCRTHDFVTARFSAQLPDRRGDNNTNIGTTSRRLTGQQPPEDSRKSRAGAKN